MGWGGEGIETTSSKLSTALILSTIGMISLKSLMFVGVVSRLAKSSFSSSERSIFQVASVMLESKLKLSSSSLTSSSAKSSSRLSLIPTSVTSLLQSKSRSFDFSGKFCV